jgi:hypothetical protein
VIGDHPDAHTLVPLAFAAMTGFELLRLVRPRSVVTDQALEKLITMFQLVLERVARAMPPRRMTLA